MPVLTHAYEVFFDGKPKYITFTTKEVTSSEYQKHMGIPKSQDVRLWDITDNEKELSDFGFTKDFANEVDFGEILECDEDMEIL